MSILSSYVELRPLPFEVSWKGPANIALVKYWGKKGRQLPANPSLSMTLQHCFTVTKTSFRTAEHLSVELFLEGKREENFSRKILLYLQQLEQDLPWIAKLSVRIDTSNSFPHGTGIASSASGFAAFALCLADYLYFLKKENKDELFLQLAGQLARLGSGSACRSLYGGFSSWGLSELAGSSDEYAIPLAVHPEMEHLQDTVMVISDAQKKISSSHGHSRMLEHHYAEARFRQAQANHQSMLSALKAGDMEMVGGLMEQEALSLHAMMMTSPDSYTLLLPATLSAIALIRDFRQETKLPLYFTLDAGPNLHLIYPPKYKSKITTFIAQELAPFSQSLIDDERGEGPLPC